MARIGLLGLEPFLVSQIERLDRNLEIVLLDAIDDDAREDLGLSVVVVNSEHAGAPRLISSHPGPPVVVVEDGVVHPGDRADPHGPIRLSRPISSPDLLESLDRSRGLSQFRRSLRAMTIQQDDAATADRWAAVARTVASLVTLAWGAANLGEVGIPALLVLTLFAIARSLWWRLSPLLVGIDAFVVFWLLVGASIAMDVPPVPLTILAAAVALEAGFVLGFWRALVGAVTAVGVLGAVWTVLLARSVAQVLATSSSGLLLFTTVAAGAMARRLWLDQTQSRSSELRRFRSALYDLSRRQAVVAVSFDIGTVAEDALTRLIADVHPRSAMVLVADGPGPLQVAASHNLASPPPVRLTWQAGMNEAQRALGSGPATRHTPDPSDQPAPGEAPDWSSLPDTEDPGDLPDWQPSRPREVDDASDGADARSPAPQARSAEDPTASSAPAVPPAAPPAPPVVPSPPSVPPSPSPVVAAMRHGDTRSEVDVPTDGEATTAPDRTDPGVPAVSDGAVSDGAASTPPATRSNGAPHAVAHDRNDRPTSAQAPEATAPQVPAAEAPAAEVPAAEAPATADHEDDGPDESPRPEERWGDPEPDAGPEAVGTFDQPVTAPPPATDALRQPQEPSGEGLTAKLLRRMEESRREDAGSDIDDHVGSRFDGQATAAPEPGEQAPLTSADVQQRLTGRRRADPEEQRVLRDLLDRTIIESNHTARLSSVLGQLAPSLPPGDVLVTGAELDGELMGALVVVGATDVRTVARHAEETALALDSVRLFNRLRAFTRDQERARIGRSLHDGVMQTLAHVAFELDRVSNDSWDESQVETLGRLRDHVLGTVDEMRAVVNDLRTVRLDRGLPAALEAMALTLSPAGGPVIEVSTGTVGSLPGDVEEQFLRIAEEGLMNAVRHSGARNVRVDLARANGALVLQVSDDGFGFTQSKVGDRDGGVGLTSMYQRAKSIGAGLDIDTGANGTIITVHQSLLTSEGAVAPAEPDDGAAPVRTRRRRRGRRR